VTFGRIKAKKPKPPKAAKPRAARRRPAPGSRGRARGGKSVKHLCGHRQVHVIPGPAWKRERELERLADRICTTCWAEERAGELEGLFELAAWPELEGTPAQVLWARSIRATALLKHQGDAAVMDRQRRETGLPPASDRYLGIVAAALLKETRAQWWIDNREADPGAVQLLDFAVQDALGAIRMEASLGPACPF
jgi:hypothetical protein